MGGFEPATSWLTAELANRLRHRDFTVWCFGFHKQLELPSRDVLCPFRGKTAISKASQNRDESRCLSHLKLGDSETKRAAERPWAPCSLPAPLPAPAETPRPQFPAPGARWGLRETEGLLCSLGGFFHWSTSLENEKFACPSSRALRERCVWFPLTLEGRGRRVSPQRTESAIHQEALSRPVEYTAV